MTEPEDTPSYANTAAFLRSFLPITDEMADELEAAAREWDRDPPE